MHAALCALLSGEDDDRADESVVVGIAPDMASRRSFRGRALARRAYEATITYAAANRSSEGQARAFP